jgi:membrane fusion protein (multidrug efflux system)
MARKRKTLTVLFIVVIVVVAAGYVAKTQFGMFDSAGAADSTAAGDSSSVAESGDKKKDGDKDKKKEAPPVPVEVAEAGMRGISSYYVTTATLEPEKKVDILAKIAGEVAVVIAEEGARVKKGDVLCRLDDKEQKVALEEARINRDMRQHEKQRFESMHEQDLISDREYGDIRYQFELAENQYQSALLRYRYTQIRAPFDGVVTERLVDPGENVTIGVRLYVVSDIDPLRLTMYLPESEIKAIAAGQTVHINPDVNPDVDFLGRIVRIAPEVDQRTGTIKVTAETHGGGIPGSFVRVRIVTDTRSSTLTMPRRGVVADAGERFVFVAEADTVRQVLVTVGYEDAEYAEILSGIEEGDTVVTAGVGGIRTGTRVKILGRDEPEITEVTDTTEAARN